MAEIAHTSSAFEKDLDDLSLNLARLGMLASRQLNACLRAMSDFQASRVDMVIEQDSELDLLEAQVNEMVLSIITMRAPRADDLRRVLATMRAAQSLERIGDYARNTAKRTKAIMASDAGDLPWDQLIEMQLALKESGEFERHRAEQSLAWMWGETTALVLSDLKDDPSVRESVISIEKAVLSGAMHPKLAAKRLLEKFKGYT